MPSAWQIHLTKFRSANPKLSLREAMQAASKSYRGAATKTAPAPKKAATKASLKATTYRSAQKGNPWLAHVQAYRASHPGMAYSEALKSASKTYRALTEQDITGLVNDAIDFVKSELRQNEFRLDEPKVENLRREIQGYIRENGEIQEMTYSAHSQDLNLTFAKRAVAIHLKDYATKVREMSASG